LGDGFDASRASWKISAKDLFRCCMIWSAPSGSITGIVPVNSRSRIVRSVCFFDGACRRSWILRETNHIVHIHEEVVESGTHGGVAVRLPDHGVGTVAEGRVANEADDGLEQGLDEKQTVPTGTALGLRVIAQEACAATPELIPQVLFVCSGTDTLVLE